MGWKCVIRRRRSGHVAEVFPEGRLGEGMQAAQSTLALRLASRRPLDGQSRRWVENQKARASRARILIEARWL